MTMAMKIRVFLLAMLLLALVGTCVVQQSARQVRAQYALARLRFAEDQTHREIAQLRAREASLSSAARLEELNHRLALGCLPLRPLSARDGDATPGTAAARRWTEHELAHMTSREIQP